MRSRSTGTGSWESAPIHEVFPPELKAVPRPVIRTARMSESRAIAGIRRPQAAVISRPIMLRRSGSASSTTAT